MLPLVFNNSLLLQWGRQLTDNDGAARITLPLAFTNYNYICTASHTGKQAAICYEDSGFRNPGWIPIRITNGSSGQQGGGWTCMWICIGY